MDAGTQGGICRYVFGCATQLPREIAYSYMLFIFQVHQIPYAVQSLDGNHNY